MAVHSDALAKIKIGERYRIMRKAEPHEGGWDNTWTPAMDAAIGSVHTVKSKSNVGVLFSGCSEYYPAHVLMPEFSIAGAYFKHGDRVRVARKSDGYTHGWGATWNNEDMHVGHVGTITEYDDGLGCLIDDYWYPEWCLEPADLHGVLQPVFKKGDSVRVRPEAKAIETKRHSWNDSMEACLGKTGIIETYCTEFESPRVGVRVPGVRNVWFFEPSALELASTPVVFKIGDKGKTRCGFEYEVLRDEPNTDSQYPLVVRVTEKSETKERRFTLDGIWSTIQKNHKFELMPPTRRVDVVRSETAHKLTGQRIEYYIVDDVMPDHAVDALSQGIAIHQTIEAGIRHQSFRPSQFPTYPCPKKETAMNPISIETRTYVDGNDVRELSQDAIFSKIAQAEAEIERLSKIKTKPKALQARINALQAGIDALAELSDARDAKDA